MFEEDRIRKEKYSLYLLPEEKAMLEACADELGMTKAEYLRKLILYGAITGRQLVIDEEQGERITYELNRIGNNINQIAYAANVQKYMTSDNWQELIKDFKELIMLLGEIPFIDEEGKSSWQQRASMLLNKQLESL